MYQFWQRDITSVVQGPIKLYVLERVKEIWGVWTGRTYLIHILFRGVHLPSKLKPSFCHYLQIQCSCSDNCAVHIGSYPGLSPQHLSLAVLTQVKYCKWQTHEWKGLGTRLQYTCNSILPAYTWEGEVVRSEVLSVEFPVSPSMPAMWVWNQQNE